MAAGLRGWNRLRRGYCPECNSSPPWPDCPICQGSYDYGPQISRAQRQQLHKRWVARCSPTT